jgi:hypothetical protein
MGKARMSDAAIKAKTGRDWQQGFPSWTRQAQLKVSCKVNVTQFFLKQKVGD